MAFYPELFGTFECIECKSIKNKSTYTQKVCIDCRPSYKKRLNHHRYLKWAKDNPEKHTANSKKWLNKNRDVLRERYRAMRKRNLAIWKLRNPEKHRFLKQVECIRRRKAGKISLKMIQELYEENIKLYGTLTCILCLKAIEFGQDSIEHKIPISRGGKSNIENLAVSHLRCNMMKNTKTVEEYLEIN